MNALEEKVVATLRSAEFEAAPHDEFHVRSGRYFWRKVEDAGLSQYVDFQLKEIQRTGILSFCVGVIHHRLEASLVDYFVNNTSMLLHGSTTTYTLYGPVAYTDAGLREELMHPGPPTDLDGTMSRLVHHALSFLNAVRSDRGILRVLSHATMGRALGGNVYWWYFRYTYLSLLGDPTSRLAFEDIVPPHCLGDHAAALAERESLDRALARDVFEHARKASLAASGP